jgi:hypothetical protein
VAVTLADQVAPLLQHRSQTPPRCGRCHHDLARRPNGYSGSVLNAVSRHVGRPPADLLPTRTVFAGRRVRDTGRSSPMRRAPLSADKLLQGVVAVERGARPLLPHWAASVHRGGVRATRAQSRRPQ